MIVRSIENCFRKAQEKKWSKTYWAFDIHGTILKPNYKKDEISTEFHPHAREVLQALSDREDIVRILYTCSYRHETEQYIAYFKANAIRFDYINANPEIEAGAYGFYDDKFYFNVLLDDKAGFDGNTDWLTIKETIQKFKH